MSEHAKTSRNDTVTQTANAGYDNLRSSGVSRDDARRISREAAETAHRNRDKVNR